MKKITLLLTLSFATIFAHGQFTFEGSYTGDAYVNASGGIERGGGYMGMGNMTIGFDTEKAGWWRGGSLFVNGASIHGRSLSENYLGDLQVASNIDAGEYAYLHELWFRQELKHFSFTVGLQDLNADFMASDAAGEFINSSFGIPPVISANVPVPIFPLTGLGVSARWDVDERFAWQAALFDGVQTPFEENPNNVKWRFASDEGVLAATEFHARLGSGTYKLGIYYHSGENNHGYYLIADRNIFESENRRLDMFAQIAAAPRSKNEHAHYIGVGANYHGAFNGREEDILGVAAAHLGLHRTGHRHETALEIYYKWQFNDNFAIQPDMQYIINPSGTGEPLKNALAGILRMHIDF